MKIEKLPQSGQKKYLTRAELQEFIQKIWQIKFVEFLYIMSNITVNSKLHHFLHIDKIPNI